MNEFDPREIELDIYRKEVKNLKEIYNLMNDELEILNTMIEISIPEEDYQKLKNQAILLIKEREEIE